MRTTHVRFTVTGLNEEELVEKAEAEIVRFYGMQKMYQSFAYTIDAVQHLVFNGEHMVEGYRATVTTFR